MTDAHNHDHQEEITDLRKMLQDQANLIAELRSHLALDDPNITSKHRAKTLEPSEDLIHYYPAIQERDLYAETEEIDDEDRFNMDEYLYTKDVVYTAPQLVNYEGVNLSTVDKAWDKKIAGVQTKLAQLTRTFDTAAHDVVHYGDPEEDGGATALTVVNTARLMVVDVIRHISTLRRDAVYTSLKLLPTAKTKQAPLVPIETLAERRKVSDLVRTNTKIFKKDGYKDKPKKYNKQESESASSATSDKKSGTPKEHTTENKGPQKNYKSGSQHKPGSYTKRNSDQQHQSGNGREEKSDK